MSETLQDNIPRDTLEQGGAEEQRGAEEKRKKSLK
jgi:hypothetical protein